MKTNKRRKLIIMFPVQRDLMQYDWYWKNSDSAMTSCSHVGRQKQFYRIFSLGEIEWIQ